MKREEIEKYLKQRNVIEKSVDKERIKSLINSAEQNVKSVKSNISLKEDTSTIIFKEIYDSIRSVAYAFWWLEGYEVVRQHEVSLSILNQLDLKNKYKLNFLERFKKIRNDASYRGFKVSVEQAKEIIDFWNDCMVEALKIIKGRI